MAKIMTGTVESFNKERGYGFITPQGGGNNIFFHITRFQRLGDNDAPRAGTAVTYQIGHDRQGRKEARKVRRRAVVDEKSLTTGTIRGFDKKRGLGFITIEGSEGDVFFHANNLRERGKEASIQIGVRASFRLGQTSKGLQAYDVSLIET